MVPYWNVHLESKNKKMQKCTCMLLNSFKTFVKKFFSVFGYINFHLCELKQH